MSIDKIKKYKEWGFNLTPANYSPADKTKDKRPIAVRNGDGKYHWNIRTKKVWSDEELVKAVETKRLAIYHNPEKYGAPGKQFFDAESDDKTFRINKYMELWPDTFTIGKKIGKDLYPTHKIYECPKDVKPKQYNYSHDIEGTKVELLCSGVSVIDGLDRLIINDMKPVEIDPKEILRHIKLSTFLAEIEPDWKQKITKKRDEAHLTLSATLAKQTDLPTKLKERYIEKFCKIMGDEEVSKRVAKVKQQEEAYKRGEELQGIDALAKLLGGNYKSFDKLKRADLLEEEEEETYIDYPLINMSTFANIKYKDPSYILEPLYTEQSTNQIFGPPGVGKTIVAQSQSIAMSSGSNWLNYKCVKPIPTLYVEGELPGSVLRQRQDTILNDYFEKGKLHNPSWSFTLCRDDLEMVGLKYGFEPIASHRLSDKDKKDYGRKGRKLIEDLCNKIKKQTNQERVFLFLDNITALSDIDENSASDWTPLLQWTNTLKVRGVPNLHVHHANKMGSSSGSSAKERMLDTQILVSALGNDQRFDMKGEKNMQCKISFTKARNFGGGNWDRPFICTMDQNGVWKRYSDLKNCDFRIIKLWKDGVRDIEELRKDKDVNLGKSTFYKHLKVLKDEKLISDDKPEKEEF